MLPESMGLMLTRPSVPDTPIFCFTQSQPTVPPWGYVQYKPRHKEPQLRGTENQALKLELELSKLKVSHQPALQGRCCVPHPPPLLARPTLSVSSRLSSHQEHSATRPALLLALQGSTPQWDKTGLCQCPHRPERRGREDKTPPVVPTDRLRDGGHNVEMWTGGRASCSGWPRGAEVTPGDPRSLHQPQLHSSGT